MFKRDESGTQTGCVLPDPLFTCGCDESGTQTACALPNPFFTRGRDESEPDFKQALNSNQAFTNYSQNN
jgi:hypothetical protein